MIKQYANSRHGQIHLRIWTTDNNVSHPPIVCLHPTPYSGLFYNTIAPHLAAGRTVIAPDYPGYGSSDLGNDETSISEFAEAMVDALEELDSSTKYDLFGFHTGCLVAVEMSLLASEQVNKLVLVDVPFFDPDKRVELHAMTTKPPVFTADADCLKGLWDRNVASRWETQPLARSLEIFTEELRAGERATRGFHAAFTYPCEEQFAAVQKPVQVIATQSSLLEPSKNTAQLIPGCTLTECPEVEAPAMETGAQIIANTALEFLNQ